MAFEKAQSHQPAKLNFQPKFVAKTADTIDFSVGQRTMLSEVFTMITSNRKQNLCRYIVEINFIQMNLQRFRKLI